KRFGTSVEALWGSALSKLVVSKEVLMGGKRILITITAAAAVAGATFAGLQTSRPSRSRDLAAPVAPAAEKPGTAVASAIAAAPAPAASVASVVAPKAKAPAPRREAAAKPAPAAPVAAAAPAAPTRRESLQERLREASRGGNIDGHEGS